MRRLREAAAIAAAFAFGVVPAAAQYPPPPESYAQAAGAEECGALTRAVGREGVVHAGFRHDGPTNFFGTSATFEVAFCFRVITQCERFQNEIRLDYPNGRGTCRVGG